MIVIDGNDGTGKTTLAAQLDTLGFAVRDRGLPTLATDNPAALEAPPDGDVYLILDAPEEVCLERLAAAGRDMTEHWHLPETLRHYRRRFREVADTLGVELLPADQCQQLVLAAALRSIGAEHAPLRVGIPKGRLFDIVDSFMAVAGFPMLVTPRNYHPECPGLRPFILKPRSIPQMIALGLLDGGFCGRDLIADSPYSEWLDVAVDFGAQRVRLVAAADDPRILAAPPRRPLVIATEFPHLADGWATGKGLAHICINTWGSTEAWVPSYADIVLDVVETGETLAAHGLTVLEEVMDSTTVFCVQAACLREQPSPIRHSKLYAALRGRYEALKPCARPQVSTRGQDDKH